MLAESSTVAQAGRSRRAAGEIQPPADGPPDRRDDQAETSASSPRLTVPAAGKRGDGLPGKGKSPGKGATVRVNARSSARLGASAQQPQNDGDQPASVQRPRRGSKSKASSRGLWSRSAGAAKRQVAAAPLVSWPGAAVLLLAVGLGTWLPSQHSGELRDDLLPAV